MSKILSFVLVLTLSILALGQTNKTKAFTGFYRGDQLKIQCQKSPTTPWGECNCIDSVLINSNKLSEIEIKDYLLNIRLDTSLKFYEPILIEIYHDYKYDLRILNPNQFFPKKILPPTKVKIDSNNFIHWETQQNYPDLRIWTQVEQKKWGDWVKIGNNFNVLEDKNFSFDLTTYLHSGLNEFRISTETIDYEHFYSKSVKIDIKKMKVKAKFRKKTKVIQLSQQTHYTLYNDKKEVVLKGISSKIDVSNLKVGRYELAYSNRRYYFIIK